VPSVCVKLFYEQPNDLAERFRSFMSDHNVGKSADHPPLPLGMSAVRLLVGSTSVHWRAV
jgi:hypothetical protein